MPKWKTCNCKYTLVRGGILRLNANDLPVTMCVCIGERHLSVVELYFEGSEESKVSVTFTFSQ